MTSTTNKAYVEPTVGGDIGTWGNELNTDLGQIDQNLGSNLAVSITSADVTLTTGASGQYQNLSYTLSGTLTGNRNLIFPAVGGFYKINNTCTGLFTVTAIISGGTGVVVPQGMQTAVWADGTNVYYDDSWAHNALGSYGGLINKFRNGAMDVVQRSLTTVAPSGAYTADGWIVIPTGASCAVATAAGRLLTVNSLKLTGAASVTDILIKQRIESYIAAPLSSQTVTVQAQVFNNTGGSITPTLTVKHATAQDNWGATSTDVNGVNLQACANSAWTQVAYTFSASASSLNGIEVTFDFGNNFTTNGKSVQITELDIRVTPGVAIGVNNAPSPPELRPISTELAFCQRYLYAVSGYGLGVVVNSTTLYNGTVSFPTTLRAQPSLVSAGYSVNSGSAGTPNIANTTTEAVIMNNTAANWTVSANVTLTALFVAEL